MIAIVRTMLDFLRKRDVKTWRSHRRACMKYLPKRARQPAKVTPAA